MHCSESGKVFRGRWNQKEVALKVLLTGDGVTPSSEVSQDDSPP
jgi:hypothetical protein